VDRLVEGHELDWSLLVPELSTTPDTVRVLGEATGVSVVTADHEAISIAAPPSCVPVAAADTPIGLEHHGSLVGTDPSIPEPAGCDDATVTPTRPNRIVGDAAVPAASELSERALADGVDGWSPGRRIGAEQ
jgi:hypothetical protein